MEYTVDFKLFRRSNNLTQVQAAEYFECDQSFISQIERGRSPLPLDFIDKILADETLDKSAITLKDDNKNMSEECMTVINRQLSLLEKRDEQIDRLITIIEDLSRK